jgi:hypothetical protein
MVRISRYWSSGTPSNRAFKNSADSGLEVAGDVEGKGLRWPGFRPGWPHPGVGSGLLDDDLAEANKVVTFLI